MHIATINPSNVILMEKKKNSLVFDLPSMDKSTPI